MDLRQLTEFFQWAAIVSIALLVFSAVLVMLLRGVMCRMHGKMFGLSEPQVAVAAYGYLGQLKALVIVFCLVPYLALLIMQ